MSVRGPSVASDVYSVPSPLVGNLAPPNAPGNFGISGANVPYATWEPRGLGGPMAPINAFVNGGQPPVSHGHITLKGFDFIQHQYLLPPTADHANMKLMRGMLCFTIREMDPDEDATLVYSVANLNQLSKDQWQDFVLATTADPNNQYLDPERLKFLRYMQKYGDKELISFAKAKERGDLRRYTKSNDKFNSGTGLEYDELNDFMQMAQQDGLCYLTLYGFLHKVNFAGVINSTNRAETLEEMDDTESAQHYVQANVNLAKRTEVGQVFGPSNKITTGSRLWITLTREYCNNGKYGAFLLVPGGSNVHERPRHLNYVDEKGDQVRGHYWLVGTVIEPAERSPQQAQIEAVNNTGPGIGVESAYRMFGTIPTMRISLGFSQ